MNRIYILFLATMLICLTIGCEKDNKDSVEPEIEDQKQDEKCDVISDYLDSTYFSYSIDNKEFNYYYLFGGLGASLEPYLKTDSVIIGFSADGEDINGKSIYLDFYYKINEKELKESDTSYFSWLSNVNNFDTLLQADNIGFRYDFIDSNNMVGAEISYVGEALNLNTTNVGKYYQEINNVTIPVNEMDMDNTYFIIEERTNLCDGHFLIEGKFEADIYNLVENKFYKLSNGKFRILMYH